MSLLRKQQSRLRSGVPVDQAATRQHGVPLFLDSRLRGRQPTPPPLPSAPPASRQRGRAGLLYSANMTVSPRERCVVFDPIHSPYNW